MRGLYSDLFTLLQQGQRKIKTFRKKIIGLFGLCEESKLCAFNCISASQIKVCDQRSSPDVKISQNRPRTANSGEGSPSILIPNNFQLDQETDLVNFAALSGEEDDQRTIGAPYFLQTVFEHTTEIKFLIVLKENGCFKQGMSDITNSLLGLLSMFKEEIFAEAELKKKLFDSVAILIARSRQSPLHENQMLEIKKQLLKSRFCEDRQHIMIELTETIISSNRIAQFYLLEQAVPKKPERSGGIVPNLNMKKWDFFHVSEAQQQHPGILSEIPFLDFSQITKVMIENCTRFSEIVKFYMNSLRNKLKAAVEEKPFTQQLLKQALDFKPVFSKIEDFLNMSDYKTESHVKVTTGTYVAPTLVDCLQNLMRISKPNENDIYMLESFEVIAQFRNVFFKFIEILSPLCSNRQDQTKIQRLKLVMGRIFRNFTVFNKISGVKLSSLKITIIVNCNPLIFDFKKDHLAFFIELITIPVMAVSFKNVKQMKRYEQLFKQYKKSFDFSYEPAQKSRQKINLTFRQMDVIFVKVEKLIGQNLSIEAAQVCIAFLRSLADEIQFIDGIVLPEDDIALIRSQWEAKMHDAIRLTLDILPKLNIKSYPNARIFAISLANLFNYVHEATCLCRVAILDEDAPDKKAEVLQIYVDICIKWGQYQDAQTALQQKLSVCTSFHEQLFTEQCLISVIELRNKNEAKFRNKINKIAAIQYQKEALNILLNNIQQTLQNPQQF